MRRRPARHNDRLSVLRNHAGHKIDIGIAVWLIDSERPLVGGRLVDRLSITPVFQLVTIYCATAAGRIRHEEHQPCRDALRNFVSHNLFRYARIVRDSVVLRKEFSAPSVSVQSEPSVLMAE